MSTNEEFKIPEFRAKIKGYTNAKDFADLFDCKSDIQEDGYVIGSPSLRPYGDESFMDYRVYDDAGVCFGVESIEIEPETRSINHPDMLDSEGTKIFASLSEDGKGGDTAEDFTFTFDGNGTAVYEGYCINETHSSFESFKVTGIQQ